MNNFNLSIFIFFICLTSCVWSHSQTDDGPDPIKNYCDSLDKLTGIQTIRKTGAGVILDYIISNGQVIKIIEHPSGYKYIAATGIYYIRNNKPVYVYADIEISNEDGSTLTIELHKIHLGGSRIIKHLTSKQTLNADSLYNKSPDLVKTVSDLRKNAPFKQGNVDPGFERILLQTTDNYLNARTKIDGDPVFDNLYSPFI